MGSSDDQNSSGSSSSDSPPSDSSSSSQSPPSSSSSSSPSPPSSDSGSSSNSGSSPPKDSSSSNGGSSSSSPPSDSGSSSSGNSGSSPPSNSGSSSSGNSGSSPPSNSGSSSSGNSGSSPPSDSGSSSSSNSGNSGSSPPSDSGSSSGNSGNSGSSPPSNNNNSNNSPPSNSNSNNSNNNSNNNNGNGGSNNGGNSNDNSNGGNSNNNNNNGGSNNNNNGSNNNNNNSNNNNGSNNNNQQKSPPSNHGNNNNQNQNNNNQNQNNNNNNQNNNNNNHQSRSSHGNSPPKSSDDFSPPAIGSGKSHKSDNSSPPSSGSSSTPVIVGVVAAAGFLLLVIVLFFLACSKRRKKRQTSSHLMENPDPYHPNGSDYWQSGPKGGDHVLNMPPSGRAPNGGWTAGAPPPMVSSEIASSNFSGPHGPPLPPPHPNVAFGFNKSTFTYEELSAATSGFAQSKLLGQGGFGYVHKGVLPNGKEIAVKSLKAGSGQGDREFGAEVEIISRVHHRHLVSLVGYCLSGERKLLVYEYVPNNNLEFHLHGQNGSSPLEWSNRIKIALGSAKGLAYLHEDCHPKIIHRDIKAANILIDYSFEAKVADFGLAKLNQENVTHVSTRVMGTFGYLAPEYASSGKLTEKSDVFSFGIMLLELITGRRPVDMSADSEEDTLVDWARPRCLKAIDTGDYSEVLDPRLENVNQEEVARMVACAAASVRHSAKKRPKMSQIVRALEGDVSMEDLHEGIKGTLGSSSTSLASSEFDTDSYNVKMKGLRKPALMDSTDYPSSEYGATNDYGHHSGSSGEMDNKKGMNRPRGPA